MISKLALLFSLISIALSVFTLLQTSGDERGWKQAEIASEPSDNSTDKILLTWSAGELAAEIRENPPAFAGKYKGKQIQFTGRIFRFEADGAMIRGEYNDGRSSLYLMCHFSDDSLASLSNYTRESQITIVGVYTGEYYSYMDQAIFSGCYIP